MYDFTSLASSGKHLQFGQNLSLSRFEQGDSLVARDASLFIIALKHENRHCVKDGVRGPHDCPMLGGSLRRCTGLRYPVLVAKVYYGREAGGGVGS